MTNARLAAIVALALGLLTLAAAAYSVIANFPRGLVLAALLIGAATAGWYGLIRRGAGRIAGLGCAAALVLASVLVVILDGGVAEAILVGATALGTVIAAKAAFAVHVPLPRAADPARPVLFYNPKSGGGKAERLNLAEEARARGIEPIELTPGSDLEQLVRDAVGRGADALAMAGGDGSQAIVAAIAAERDLPYACIPAGTRNHFALDLGVDRDDVVGALDAFVGGGERRVDLAEVNGRVFVNNVSLGLYAEAVQREGYREAKLRTIVDTLPDVLGPEAGGLDLRWTGARRPQAYLRRGDPGLQQPLPAGPGSRLGNPPEDRRRLARADGGRRPAGPWRRPPSAAPMARVVGARVRGRGRPLRARRHRRRGGRARAAAPLPDQAGGAAGANRPAASRRLALGSDAREPSRHRRGGARDCRGTPDRLKRALLAGAGSLVAGCSASSQSPSRAVTLPSLAAFFKAR